jgi:diguanylate cyclase (GGDEF)-like protein/PAS domain S-box-containing protein
MQALIDAIGSLAASREWLVTANVILSALLALWMLRYRQLYRRSAADRIRSDDLIENLDEGIYRSSLDGRQLAANRALVRLNGYGSEHEMLSAVTDIGAEWYVDPQRRAEFRRILDADGKVVDFVSEVYRHKSRERIWISESARIVRDATGTPTHYEGSVRDITATVERLKLEEMFRKLTVHLPGGLFQITAGAGGDPVIDYLSEGFNRLTGITFEEHRAAGALFKSILHPDDFEGYFATFRESYETLEPIDHEFRVRMPNGQEKWLRMSARPERVGDTTTFYGHVDDVSLRKRQAIEIEKLAYFDPLTRLPNRRMFLDHMSRRPPAHEDASLHGALLFIDLDNFKTLNDTHGHDVGDALLGKVALRLRECVTRRDLVARIGGDEFVVVLERSSPDHGTATLRAVTTANRILSALQRGFDLGPITHTGSASIGLVVHDGSERRADELLKRADIAMYQAKAAGRNGLALYAPDSGGRRQPRHAHKPAAARATG